MATWMVLPEWEVLALLSDRKSELRRPLRSRLPPEEVRKNLASCERVEVGFDGLVPVATFYRPNAGSLVLRSDYATQTPIAVRECWIPEAFGISYRAGHPQAVGRKWKSATSMPSGLWRVRFTILDARVERLHQITEDDARGKEGVVISAAEPTDADTCREEFASLWEGSYHEKSPWAANDFVWVYTIQKTPYPSLRQGR